MASEGSQFSHATLVPSKVEMEISFQRLDGTPVDGPKVYGDDLVSDICKELDVRESVSSVQEKIQLKSQVLLLDDARVLQSDLTIADCGVKPGSTLNFIRKQLFWDASLSTPFIAIAEQRAQRPCMSGISCIAASAVIVNSGLATFHFTDIKTQNSDGSICLGFVDAHYFSATCSGRAWYLDAHSGLMWFTKNGVHEKRSRQEAAIGAKPLQDIPGAKCMPNCSSVSFQVNMDSRSLSVSIDNGTFVEVHEAILPSSVIPFAWLYGSDGDSVALSWDL